MFVTMLRATPHPERGGQATSRTATGTVAAKPPPRPNNNCAAARAKRHGYRLAYALKFTPRREPCKTRCGWPLTVQTLPPRRHCCLNALLGTQPQVCTRVRFCHGAPCWHMSVTSLFADGCKHIAAMGGQCHNRLELPFSSATGTLCSTAASIIFAVHLAVLLPSLILRLSAARRKARGCPQMCCPFKRKGPPGDPGYPRRAVDQELHGVPNQTARMLPARMCSTMPSMMSLRLRSC